MEEITYEKIYNLSNLLIAWRKARKHKTKKFYVKDTENNLQFQFYRRCFLFSPNLKRPKDLVIFENDLRKNLIQLQKELKIQTYKPEPLKTFILRDPKTRKISKSAFRDRIVHHALINIIGNLFEKSFGD